MTNAVTNIDNFSHAEPARKKMKVGVDQTFDQIGDILAASGVSQEEEERYLLPLLKVKRESFKHQNEDKMLLEKGLLHQKVVGIAKTCNISIEKEDVELCLSLSLEEFLRAIVCKLISCSNQRQGTAKENQQVVVTSDIRNQIALSRKMAREAFDAKQGSTKEAETHQKENEGQKGKKKEKEPAVGRDKPLSNQMESMLTKWTVMAEQGRLKRGMDAGIRQNQVKGLQKDVEADMRRQPGFQDQVSKEQRQKPIIINDLTSVLENYSCTAKSELLYKFFLRSGTKSNGEV
ncbi:hypothetical protein GOP47_0022208 [Adiantum capillus-veneris]|uniref:Transcription initiation factor TFIID component TAF4 C-terminal domain-containing protein n=1 Tax=Adiantum capillus-veneris TaxID=13818 RepID=A0A9D4UAX1_ADICA|nr:hypothetical protein GOP47_0021681 [Adiantum capillus-veneris]KAI5063661.1 hypothetical protein GOP47_0022208 [Adiantum capillus-veneris]